MSSGSRQPAWRLGLALTAPLALSDPARMQCKCHKAMTAAWLPGSLPLSYACPDVGRVPSRGGQDAALSSVSGARWQRHLAADPCRQAAGSRFHLHSAFMEGGSGVPPLEVTQPEPRWHCHISAGCGHPAYNPDGPLTRRGGRGQASGNTRVVPGTSWDVSSTRTCEAPASRSRSVTMDRASSGRLQSRLRWPR